MVADDVTVVVKYLLVPPRIEADPNLLLAVDIVDPLAVVLLGDLDESVIVVDPFVPSPCSNKTTSCQCGSRPGPKVSVPATHGR
jgi:hypothetical protein